MHTNKRLVFHFFIYEGCFNSKIYKLHLACLSCFAHVFDQAIFVLSLDDVENLELIRLAEKTILERIFIKDTKFIVRKNDKYREAGTFYSEIADKLDKLDGLTFFGHVKGAGNEFDQHRFNIEQVYHWVIGAYFFNFFDMNEMEWYLVSSPSFCTYGAFKCYWESVENKYAWLYSGTFFWVNGQRIDGFMKKYEIPMPPLNNRYCAETFCGNILKFDNAESAAHNNFLYIANQNVEFLDWYNLATTFIEDFLDDRSREEYYNFRDNILKEIEA